MKSKYFKEKIMSHDYKVEQDMPEDDEENEGLSNDDLFNITSWGADLSFRELVAVS